jgi:hypothetical protein
MQVVVPAGERIFRLYNAYCIAPDLDTLFNLLNGIHSLNDKLFKAKLLVFFELDEFVALKALRNLFHHQEELVNELRLIPVQDLPPITTDLLHLCLIPSELVEKSISTIPKKYRVSEEPIIRSVLGWYGDVVNINPCIFNFMVKAYQNLTKAGVNLAGDEYLEFSDSYRFETDNGHSHFITGAIGCHVGSVDVILQKAYASVT